MFTLDHKHGRILQSDPRPLLVTRILDKIKNTHLPPILHQDLFSITLGEKDKNRLKILSPQFLGRKMLADFIYLKWDKHQEVPLVITENGVTVRSAEDYDIYGVVINLLPFLERDFNIQDRQNPESFVYKIGVDLVDHRLYLIELPLNYSPYMEEGNTSEKVTCNSGIE